MTTYSWNTQTTAVGNRTITATAYDDAGNSASASISVTVEEPPPPRPVLVVTRKVERQGTGFIVTLDVENNGEAIANNIEIVDRVRGFQAKGFGLQEAVTYDHLTKECEVRLAPYENFGVAPHNSTTLQYCVAPILFEDLLSTSYAIGTSTHISYQAPTGETYEEDLSIPATQVEVNPGDYRNVAHATDYTIAQADYLLVTNPSRLFDFYNSREVDILLYHMAQLAWLKQGVLGYLDSYDTDTLDALIESNGGWAVRLHPNFSTTCGGYLLIVGETEIVPSWMILSPPHVYGALDLLGYYAPYVDLTDHPYSDTGGNGAPDLIVGRIIGNNPAALIRPIQVSIGVYEGLPAYNFGRSRALLVSGTGFGEDLMRIGVNIIGEVLDDEFTVTKLHWQDYSFDAWRLDKFRDNTPNRDVIYFCGHGGPKIWSPALETDDEDENNDFPVDFGNKNPFAFASACLTGSYENHHVYGGGDISIAEAFFDSGAAVYIGSTEISFPLANHESAKKFFKWWDASDSIGKTFLEVERFRWNRYYLLEYEKEVSRYWVIEYNLYGDPKFGAVEASSSAASAKYASAEPPSSLDIVVPDYQVTTRDGIDYVEIPDGDILPVEGKPQVPCWSVSIEYPKGYNVQDVVLTDRSGLVTDTGLNMPIITYGIGSLPSDSNSESPSDQGEGWFPEEKYSWGVTENPDGSSTLAIIMYAFCYNPLTTDIRFYKNYSFDIAYTISPVAITSLATDKNEYEQADTVIVDVELNNSGPAQDVIVNAVIKRYGSAEIMDGLLLESLKEFVGPACFSPQWYSNDSEPGYYCVEVTLKDKAGDTLDRKTEMFRLGISSGEITNFTVTPDNVEVGDDTTINMTFENTGTVNITGYASIKIVNSSGNVIDEFEHTIADLMPSEWVSLSDTWNVSEAGPCKIMGYVSYDSKSTDQVIVEINKDCFPSTYTTYNDWVTLGKPDCWCAKPNGSGYQCDGDADGKDSGGINKFRVFTGDLSLIVANWRKKAGDPTLDPCADIDHMDSGGLNKYRVFTGDLSRLVANWKKNDKDLPGNCPRPE